MATYEFLEEIPGKQMSLLQQLRGRKLEKVVRCCWDTFEQFDPDGIYNIAKDAYFRLAAGSAVVALDNGWEISFSSIEEIASIVVWVQKDENGAAEDYFRDDHEVMLIDNRHPDFTQQRERDLSGKQIVSVNIFRRNPPSVLYEDLPNEAGVELVLENGERLVFSHNLIPAPDSFSIGYRDEIPASVLTELTGRGFYNDLSCCQDE